MAAVQTGSGPGGVCGVPHNAIITFFLSGTDGVKVWECQLDNALSRFHHTVQVLNQDAGSVLL